MMLVLLAGASTSACSKRSHSGAQLPSASPCSNPARGNQEGNPAALVADRCHQKGLPLSRLSCCSPLRAPESLKEAGAWSCWHECSLFPEPCSLSTWPQTWMGSHP